MTANTMMGTRRTGIAGDGPTPSFQFGSQFDELDRAMPSRWQALRQRGRAEFRKLSFPTARTEDWRFTSVAPLLQQRFALATRRTVDAQSLPPLAHADAIRLTFVDGHYVPALSVRGEVPTGVLVGNLADPGPAAEAIERHLGRIAESADHVFGALNLALLGDGAFVIVPANVALDRPIEILHVSDPAGRNVDIQPRTLVAVGANARATVFERFLGLPGEGRPFTNAVTEIVLADGAIVDHVKLLQETDAAYHVANTQAVLARGSNFTTHSVLLSGGWVRNEVRVRFDDEGAEATVNGLYIGQGAQHLDTLTVIDHAKPHCASHELYKGVLGGKSQGVFNGKIFVRKDAQKTDAKQTNKVLLLSDDAVIHTKPQLEIFADDVKCTHGATIGQLSEEQTFYLRSRGVGADEARRILTFAFANDVVGRIKLERLRDEIEAILVPRD
jgi:Fe-S cluster assembly protein SufD